MSDNQNHLNWLERFISTNYAKQPVWVRTFTYLLFAILLFYGLSRLIGGEYSVRGRILQEINDKSGNEVFSPANNYDVQVGDKLFGTNSRGFYYIILGSFQYYRLLLNGKMIFRISKSENIFNPQQIRFDRLNGEFEDIILTTRNASERVRGSKEDDSSIMNFLIRSAFAEKKSEETDRLFVTAFELSAGHPGIKEGSLDARIDCKSFDLLSVQTRGLPAGEIPIYSGKKVVLGKDYYFNIKSLNSSTPLRIEFSTQSGSWWRVFSSYSETFKLDLDLQYGRKLSVTGDKGSKIELEFLSSYQVVMWEKLDLEEVMEELKSEFTESGFRVSVKHSPLGYKAQTNAIFGGSSVPFNKIQNVLRIAKNNQIDIKTIEYKLNLRSGNPYEIQLGGFRVYDSAPPISNDKIEELLNAPSESEFTRILEAL